MGSRQWLHSIQKKKHPTVGTVRMPFISLINISPRYPQCKHVLVPLKAIQYPNSRENEHKLPLKGTIPRGASIGGPKESQGGKNKKEKKSQGPRNTDQTSQATGL